MSKWMLSLASVTLLALAMSGCGGSDGSSSVSDGGSSVTPPAGDNNTPTTQTRDFTSTPNQFGDKVPAVPVIPDLAD